MAGRGEPDVTATFRPGYTEYQLADAKAGWKASLRIAPALDFHGLVCRVKFDKEASLVWQYGGMFWVAGEANANRVEIHGSAGTHHRAQSAQRTGAGGWDGEGEGRAVPRPCRPAGRVRADQGPTALSCRGRVGRDPLRPKAGRPDHGPARHPGRTPPGPNSARAEADVVRLLHPPGPRARGELPQAAGMRLPNNCAARGSWWDRRRQEFQIRTPDRAPECAAELVPLRRPNITARDRAWC